MSYVVFARRWRPKDFDEVIGQEHITTTLKNAISNDRVAHAYIFTGLRGVGKTSVARIFAKSLNCEEGPTVSPCNKCVSCNEITSGSSMDVIEIDGASNNSVDQVRELRENIKFMPSHGRYKLYIIDEVHMLSIGAFNALLKTLEEPPKHAKFIFATTNPEKVPPTVLSRCQRFDFRRIPVKLIISKLEKITKIEKLNVSEDAIFSIAKAADGSIRDAESILDQLASFCEKKIGQGDVIALLGIIDEDRLADVIEKLSKKDTAGLLKEIDGFIIQGKDISQFLTGLMTYLRNLMILKVSSDLSALVDLPDNHIARLKRETRNFEIDELLYMFYTISATANAIKRSEVSRFIVEAALIKLSLRSEMMSLAEITDKISRLEANIGKTDSFREEPRPQTADYTLPSSAKAAEGRQTANEEPIAERAKPLEPARESAVSDIAGANRESAQAGPPGESAAKSDAVIMLTMESVKKTWPRLLQIIKSKKISIASYLLEGEIMKINPLRNVEDSLPKNKTSNGVNGSIIVLGFTKKFNFHKETLERLNNKKFVEEIASEVFGQRIQFEFVTLEEFKVPAEESGSSSKFDIAEEGLEREAKKDAFEEPIIQSAIEIFDGKIVKEKEGSSGE